MAAPTFTDRGVPDGVMLEEGYQTLISFSSKPNIAIWEKTIKPFGMDNGDMINITTMLNETVHTKAPRALIDFTDMTGTCAYDPAALDDLIEMLGEEQSITITHPDGSQDAVWAALIKFEPQERSIGTHAEANFTIGVTNRDPTTGTEELPDHRTPAGTT